MFLLTEFPLTTDLVLSTLINTLLSERKFFIAFTGMAIGYIKSISLLYDPTSTALTVAVRERS